MAHTQSLEFHLQNLAKHIRKHQGQPFDIQEYFFRYTVDTATEFLFGHSLFGLMDESIGLRPLLIVSEVVGTFMKVSLEHKRFVQLGLGPKICITLLIQVISRNIIM